MGTRSVTYILDEKERTLALIYRQFDGYPDGMGKDLYNILVGRPIVCGFPMEELENPRPPFNGMGDLAATVVRDLKKGIGNVYLFAGIFVGNVQSAREKYDAEFVYIIGARENALTIQAYSLKLGKSAKLLYSGAIEGMPAALKFEEEEACQIT